MDNKQAQKKVIDDLWKEMGLCNLFAMIHEVITDRLEYLESDTKSYKNHKLISDLVEALSNAADMAYSSDSYKDRRTKLMELFIDLADIHIKK